MATLSAALRDALAARAVQNLDTLEILDADGVTVLATITGITWGTPSNGAVNANNLPIEVTAAAGGTATTARLKSSTVTTETIDGLTVGTSGAQVTMANTSIAQGQPVRLQSLTFTQSDQVT